jgi:hypothetical protein
MVSIKICPKCGSKDVEVDTSNIVGNIGAIPQGYVCNHCSFTSPFFPEIESENVEEFQEEFKKGQEDEPKHEDKTYSSVDIRYGNFLVFWWKITGVIMIILGIFLGLQFYPLFFLVLLGIIQLLIVYHKHISKVLGITK